MGFQGLPASGQARPTTEITESLANTSSVFLFPLPPWLPNTSSDGLVLSLETLLHSLRVPSWFVCLNSQGSLHS